MKIRLLLFIAGSAMANSFTDIDKVNDELKDVLVNACKNATFTEQK